MEAKLKTDGEERVTWDEEERERRGLLRREKAGPMLEAALMTCQVHEDIFFFL